MKIGFESLKVGSQYRFNFTHKKNVYGVVCEVDSKRERFVVFDIVTKEYEGIPLHRFMSAENH